MSLVQRRGPERQPSPSLALNLPSNNPFRIRAASPASFNSLPSPQSPTFNINSAPPERSKNPFAEFIEVRDVSQSLQAPDSPRKAMPAIDDRISPKKQVLNESTVEIFNNLSIGDKAASNGTRQVITPIYNTTGSTRLENIPPSFNGRSGMVGHRPSQSQEEEQQRLRNGGKPRGPTQGRDVFADPPEIGKPREVRRSRRNSDSSVADKTGRIVDADDERRRKERRHKEREAKYRAMKGKSQAPTSKPKKPYQGLDIIDKLDVTSIYGTGLFHHDGPFDACNPHRNRKGTQRAPMQAFPEGSANNVIGGSGPVNKNINIAQFHGHAPEGFTDFSTSGATNPVADPAVFEPYTGATSPVKIGQNVRPEVDRTNSFDPTSLIEPVHGDESMGLGTSTFLEGAPASRIAIQRRESDAENQGFGAGAHIGGGLTRKRSLAQKIRGISNTNRNGGSRIRMTSPEFERTTSPIELVQSAGGIRGVQNSNPFFNDYDDAYEKKGARIQISEEQNRFAAGGARSRAPSDPRRGFAGATLERRATGDGIGVTEPENKASGGFLSRVKSLKGGRRARPEKLG